MNDCCPLDCELVEEDDICAEVDNVEVVRREYSGKDTEDIDINVDNENHEISAILTNEVKEKLNSIPEKTSDLVNDGEDGTSPFATEEYVKRHGGKIDKIKRNNVDLPIDPLDKSVNIAVPVALSELQNDTEFINNTVDNLINYYKKSETYTRSEINTLILNIPTVKIEIVSSLPIASNSTYFNNSKTIYMTAVSGGSGNDYYNEYITIRTGSEGSYSYSWELIGNTKIDLTNYVQKSRKIAGIDLEDDITVEELQQALKVLTTDTNQDINGLKTFLSQLRVKRPADGGGYFYVSPDGNGHNVKIGFSSGGEIMIHNGGIQPNRSILPTGSIDLGSSTNKWKDLCLSGKVDFGDGATISKDSSDRINFNYSNDAKVKVGSAETTFKNRIGADSDNSQDIGRASVRWKDGYFAGVLSDGTNSITIADIANKNVVMFKPLSLSTTTMTDDQITQLRNYNCVLTNDLTLGTTSLKAGSILTVPFEYSNSLRGIAIYNNRIMTYYINLNNKQISDGAKDIVISQVANINTDRVTIDNYTINKDSFGQLQIGNNNATSMQFDGGTVRAQNLVPMGNNLKDLGNSSQKWKDLHLAGNLTDGTNSISVADIASTTYVDTKIGDIDTLLTALNSGSGV